MTPSKWTALVVVGGFAGWLLWPVAWADVSSLREKNPRSTALIRLRERQSESRERSYDPIRTWIDLDSVSPALKKAVLAAEDDGFYRHNGVEWRLMRDALLHDLKERRWSRGASTITQQLAKNLFLSPSKNPLRKIREILLAFRLERTLRKDRIFELYLNVAEWGEGVFGAEAAAQIHFGKSAAELTWDEAIALAAVLPSPRKNRPTDDSRWVAFRKRWVRQRLIENRWLPPEADWIVPDQTDVQEIPVVDDSAVEEMPYVPLPDDTEILPEYAPLPEETSPHPDERLEELP